MSVARITTINFKNKEDADKSIEDYFSKSGYFNVTWKNSRSKSRGNS